MRQRLRHLLARLSWAQNFLLVSLVVFLTAMLGVGWWVGQQIESSVIQQTALNVALYVSSFVEPNLQELAGGQALSAEHREMLAGLLTDTSMGQHITGIKIWDMQGRVVYSTNARIVGLTFPMDPSLSRALRGWVAADVGNLTNPENVYDYDRGQRRLETYIPVRRMGTRQIIAAIEFYQTVDELDHDIAAAQQRSWLIVGGGTLAAYLLLAGFVRRTSDTIRRQQNELSNQVLQLTALLAQNKELHERVRRAARRTAALNERFLRRISAELHDGPVQDLGLALLRLDHLLPRAEPAQSQAAPEAARQSDFQIIQSSLWHALQEIRAISAGMGLPELEQMTLAETVARAVRAHERRTNTPVTLAMNGAPDTVSISLKITVYRIVQEALSNAYRHAGAVDQLVQLSYEHDLLSLTISDRGPGFEKIHETDWEEHLGLGGMRERAESLGGIFQIESELGRGTRVVVQLPLDVSG